MQASAEDRRKVWVLALVGLLYALTLAYLLNQTDVVRLNSDFLSRWYAMDKLLIEGRNLYDTQNGVEVVAYSGAANDPSVGYFYYPAHILLLLLPFGLLSYHTAHLLWVFAGQMFFFLGTWFAIRAAGWPRTINRITLFLALGALLIPNLQHSIWGQFNTIAVLCLGLCYWQLVKGNYLWAGMWAAGLTFKPQATLLPLLFLLAWAMLRRERWRFLLGAGSAGAGLWLFAELLQPGWVGDFLAALQEYLLIPGYQIQAVFAGWGLMGTLLAIILTLLLATLIYRYRAAASEQPVFKSLLVYSLALGWMLLPIVGMYHIVAAPLAAALLLSALGESRMEVYRPALVFLVLLYLTGLGVFVYGLLTEYGLHIDLTEAVYKVAVPLTMLVFSMPLLVRRNISGSET